MCVMLAAVVFVAVACGGPSGPVSAEEADAVLAKFSSGDLSQALDVTHPDVLEEEDLDVSRTSQEFADLADYMEREGLKLVVNGDGVAVPSVSGTAVSFELVEVARSARAPYDAAEVYSLGRVTMERVEGRVLIVGTSPS